MIDPLTAAIGAAIVATGVTYWLTASGCNGHHWEDNGELVGYRTEVNRETLGLADKVTVYRITEHDCEDCNKVKTESRAISKLYSGEFEEAVTERSDWY